ncbi:GNAT family N-acetyltransferase [Ketobacter alkanivorans]|nr:GNAT family N-acetyltransferase [Ketobacter alkanivorans]MCP5019313.1 GNAT family N-acetyltransferase [Ketobacter sp.]
MADLLEQQIIAPYDSDWYRQGCDLRRVVFMEEQGVSLADEFDGKDPDATHIVTVQNDEVVGVLRVLWLPEHAKIGRFAVRKDLRNEGIGSRLFHTALSFIDRKGVERVMLEAQIDRIEFYENFGFEAYGDEYLDAGILHRAMKNY